MRRPWELAGQPMDDMEALQTDVMRFMAILGLCLTAIFSLLKTADPQTTNTAPIEPASTSGSEERPVPKSIRQAVTEQEEEVIGFSLEFSSADSFRQLLDSGSAQLYVSDGERYWRWSRRGGFSEIPAPGSYYGMQPHTVPQSLQRAAPVAIPIDSQLWGVTLEAATAARIGELMTQRQGGALVIAVDGSVAYDDE